MDTVYGITDGTADYVRYIGIARHMALRLDKHVDEAVRRIGTHKRHWLRAALDAGHAIEIESLDDAPTRSDALWLERLWICVYRACGVPLTNATDGGEGLLNPTPATRQKMRDSHLGKRLSEATKAKMRAPKRYPATRKAHPPITDDTRARMRAAALRRAPVADEVKTRIAASRRGQTHSPKTKALMTQRQRERWAHYTPEQRADRVQAAALGGGFGSTSVALKGATARWGK